ncbi:NtaA/DmoA family FMN-dependent monooxygenase [Paenarthrobacter sp. CC6]|uniref:NtaA/DmoA family FMN-dependent monooxygenase n=1 Tax=Paenarthrobacter sp. CC6 TaxID=3029184 RepID=UPI00339BD5B0
MGTEHITVCAMPHAGGFHQASWRRSGAKGNDIWNPDLWKDIARTAERGLLDAVFFADNAALWPVPEHLRHHTAKVGVWDAIIAASVAASVTDHIGVIATAHTEFQQPYILARQMACLDHLSRGRIGWNIVTSGIPAEYANFGKEQILDKEKIYAKATEFVEVVKGLWDSWEDDAYVIDQDSGVFFDPDKLHTLDHQGKYYSARGPLNVMRSPQGYPVLAQAGGSGPGKVLAGTVGELIFTPLSGEAGIAYRKDIHEVAAQVGRKATDIKVLAQLMPVVAPTDEEAQEKWAELQRLLHPDIARGAIESMLREDISGYPLDEPLPETTSPDAIVGYRDAVLSFRMPDGRKPTVRELIENYKGPGTVVGSPSTIADYMENEIESGACDGFCLLVQGLPEELEDFVNLVVPELQKRGRFRTSYKEGTLRDQLGFARPENQFALKPESLVSQS